MAVEEEGQSIVEFLLMLPLLIGLTVVLIRVNTAIQISIVDQQYARAQALFLTFNSPVYPAIPLQNSQMSKQMNQMIIGVSENSAGSGAGEYVPKAQVQLIARNPKAVASDSAREEPTPLKGRAKVRIRNTVTLCTPTFLIKAGKGMQPMLAQNGISSLLIPTTVSQGGQIFSTICGSSIPYEQ